MPPAKTIENTAVLVLAGGGGTRLGGVIKANLKIEGKSLFDRVANNVGRIEGPHILSIGNMPKQRFSVPQKWILLHDLKTGHKSDVKGPLAGIAAGVCHIRQHAKNTRYMLSVAVDSPFFPGLFTKLALDSIENERDVVVASFGGQIYPTNALWRLKAIKDLPEEVESLAKYGIKGLLRKIRVKELALDEYFSDNPCQNLNDITDIARINDRARSVTLKTVKKDVD